MFAAKDTLLTRPSGGYVIPRSLRFRSSATAYLNRTFGTPTNQSKFTLSVWLKRGALSAFQSIIASGTGASDTTRCEVYFTSGDLLTFQGGTTSFRTSTQVFRDPSAWGHLVLAVDTTLGTEALKLRAYWNNQEVTWGTTNAITTCAINSATLHRLGYLITNVFPFDGYWAETNFVDGQQLTPTSFGATNATTGVWAPIKYTGTYGANGFHLDFNSYATTAALGTDTSGNGNTWTVNNLSVTAGVTYDSMIDVPTVTDTGSNYAVLNPLDLTNGATNATATFSQGNLAVSSGSSNQLILGSVGMDSGLWYWECTTTTGTIGGSLSGVALTQATRNSYGGYDQYSWVLYYSTGTKLTNNANAGNGVTYLGSGAIIGDVVCCAFNRTTGKIWWRVNNNAWGGAAGGDPVAGTGEAFSGLNTGTIYPCINADTRATNYINFGQRPFAYTPPTGFKSLNTYNLAAPSILKGNEYMDATTYTGTGASLSVTNAGGFQPGFVWAKSRSAATDHALYDSVRGTTKQLESNTTTAETTEATGLTAFNSTGFTVGALAQMNTSAATYVGWQWKGGGAAVTNTNGTMSAQVSANPTSGCSICSFTTPSGTVNPNTFGHGLGVAPSFVITKAVAVAQSYDTYHVGVGNTARILLNTTGAASTANAQYWNNTTPSSTVVTIGTTAWWGSSTNYIAYCFAPIAGYSAFGSYTGNASTDGPFVFTGFRPRWVLFKSSSSVNNWQIYDTSRNTSNATTNWIYPDVANAEATSGVDIDILSNGFKPRSTNAINNGSGVTYIYAAFAESPFKNSLAR